ncbi:hypothetical protein [Bradyrhizobium sp. JR3.5]
MARKPNPEFGKRRPAVPPRPDPPSKRSSHVALLMMGTLAVGGSAYALMPRQNCQPIQPTPPGVTAPAPLQPGADCAPRSSSSGSGGSGGGSSHSSFYSGSSSSGGSSSSSGSSSSASVSRGGFGSFAHAFGFGGG